LTSTSGTRFDAGMTDLTVNTIYYIRAWASDSDGNVIYGNPIPFATRRDYFASGTNQGVLRDDEGTPYEFSVSATKKVYFSMGNLQYRAQGGSAGNASATAESGANIGGTWRFAEHQFDYVGNASDGIVYDENGTKCNNLLTAQDYTGWVDLFAWGTSGYNHNNGYYQPWCKDIDLSNVSKYYVYDMTTDAYNLYDQTGIADWGYNKIINGGNTENYGWRTLVGNTDGGQTLDGEWEYVLRQRSGGYNNHRWAHVQIVLEGTSNHTVSLVNNVPACGVSVYGLILFPDNNFVWPSLVGEFTAFEGNSNASTMKITEAEWSMLEQAGAVFLPGAGERLDDVYGMIQGGDYNSSTHERGSYSNSMSFITVGDLTPYHCFRGYGLSVRLVKDAPSGN